MGRWGRGEAYNDVSYNIIFIFTIWPIIFTNLVIHNDIVSVDKVTLGKCITFGDEEG